MKEKSKNSRWRLFADAKVQGGLCIRLAIYWIACQLVFVGTVYAFEWLTQESNPDGHFLLQGFIVSSLFLPLAMYDLITFSNRFAGPVWNLRNKLQDMVEGQEVDEIRFRPGDFYPDLMNNFNELKRSREIKSLSPESCIGNRTTSNSNNEELLV